MAPFKRHGRKNGPYYVWVRLPGVGRVGPWSSGTKNREIARSMQNYVKETWLRDPELVRGVIAGKYSLRALWVARQEGRVDELRALLKDPLLADVVKKFRPHVRDRRIEDGLDLLLELAPAGARLSYIASVPTNPGDPSGAKNISDLCGTAMAAGRRPNSVRRSLYRSVSDLLKYEVGKVRTNMVLTDVVKPGEKDERDVKLAPEEIERILNLADDQMRDVISFALLTGIDRGPIERLEVRDYHPEDETADVPDTKTDARPRRIPLSAPAAAILRRLTARRRPSERVFGLTGRQIQNRFEKIREDAELPHVRFKDLRGVFATYWPGTLKELMQAMGHGNAKTTMRYIKNQPVAKRDQMDAVAERMGLTRPYLRAEGGAE